MVLLVISIVTLMVAPVVAAMVPRGSAVFRVFDGYILVTIGALVLFELLPSAVGVAGPLALLAAIAGLMLPSFLESRIHARTTHRGVIALVLLGLTLHAMMDGTALGLSAVDAGDGHIAHDAANPHTLELMALGVILHRLPLGLLLWWVIRPLYGHRGVAGVIALVSVATVAGYAAEDAVIGALPPTGLALFVAVVAGALLHVVLHAFHPLDDHQTVEAHDGTDACCEPESAAPPYPDPGHDQLHVPDPSDSHAHQHSADAAGQNWAEVMGAVLGVGTLLALRHAHPSFSMVSGELTAATMLLTLALESAPALVIAYVGAGLLRAFLSPGSVRWLGRGGSLSQAFRGVTFGLPLPVCSCGVLPLYESLTVAGAPAAAAVAFLVATPELGLDAVLLSLPLLGVEMTILRVVVASLIALLAGVVAVRVFRRVVPAGEGLDFQALAGGLAARLREGLRYGLVDVVDHTLPWILVGLGVAAVLEPMLSLDQLAAIPDAAQVPLFALVGIPLYVCAAGATPLAAVLMHKGLSAGAAIAFLMTGPATNITTFGVISRLHGRRAALVFGAVVAGAAILSGWGVNLIGDAIYPPELHDAAHAEAYPLQLLSLVLLILITLASLGRQGLRGMVAQVIGER